jgi:hypothetical protein
MTADRDEGHGINGTKSRTSASAGKGEMGEGNMAAPAKRIDGIDFWRVVLRSARPKDVCV